MSLKILICTNPKNIDVLNHMLTSLNKSTKPNYIEVFISKIKLGEFSNIKFNFIDTYSSNWKDETLYQLEYIKTKHVDTKNILIILDDFLFYKNINWEKIHEFNEQMIINDMKHLMLKPIDDSILNKIYSASQSRYLVGEYFYHKIRKNHPYYYSLQICIWDINYLIASINSCKNIWDFETQQNRVDKHYCIKQDFIFYKHIVEKGKWTFYAQKYCNKNIGFFLPGTRGFGQYKLSEIILFKLRKYLIFPIFGYSILKMKQYFSIDDKV